MEGATTTSELTAYKLRLKQRLVGLKKRMPPHIKEEIWSERGTTKLEYEDVFGQENVAGWNSAIDECIQQIEVSDE